MRRGACSGASVEAGPTRVGLATRAIDSPVGTLFAVASARGLHWLGLERWDRPAPQGQADGAASTAAQALLDRLENELACYFNGQPTRFSVPVQFPEWASQFSLRVWLAATEIPYGETTTYGSLAALLGNSKYARPVGAALARNPCLIVVPCHRVVGAGGRLGGYAAGKEIKEFLLALEAAGAVTGRGCQSSARAHPLTAAASSGADLQKAEASKRCRRGIA